MPSEKVARGTMEETKNLARAFSRAMALMHNPRSKVILDDNGQVRIRVGGGGDPRSGPQSEKVVRYDPAVLGGTSHSDLVREVLTQWVSEIAEAIGADSS